MKILQNRIDSFQNNVVEWPYANNSKYAKTEAFAKAGFYFVGSKNAPDCVRCFICNIELSQWKSNQSPYVRHGKRSPHCAWKQLNFPEAHKKPLSDPTAAKLASAGFYFTPTTTLPSRVKCANTLNTPSTPSTPSISGTPSTSGKITSSTVKASINQSDKETIVNTFSSLDRKKMWTLSTGTIVELKMEELSNKCNYDHPSHSLILDPEDATWNDYFTKQELEEIRLHGNPRFETVPMSTATADLSNKNLLQMHEVVGEHYVNPLTDNFNYWIKKSVTEGLDILLSNKLHSNIDSVWKVIPWAVDQGKIVVKREQTSEISNEQMNQRRRLSSVVKIDRQKTGKRLDMLFKYDSYELGLCEAKKSSKEYSDGSISDQQIKAPKILKGMLMKLVTVAPTKLRQIETIAIITTGLKIKLLVMDCPSGYVCRIRKTDTAQYPSTEGFFVKSIKKCLSLVWCARLTMEKSIERITGVEDEEYSDSNVKLTPCFYPSDSKSQKTAKRKLESLQDNI